MATAQATSPLILDAKREVIYGGDICRCTCHKYRAMGQAVYHSKPCCQLCEDCGNHIVFGMWESHQNTHKIERGYRRKAL